MTEFIKENEEIEIPILEIRKEVEEEQNKRLNTIKSNRNNQDVEASLLKIQECCKSGENLMPSIIKSCRIIRNFRRNCRFNERGFW